MIEPREEIRDLKEYRPPLEGRHGKIRLDFNENVKGCSPKVIDALRKISMEQIAAYPEYQGFIEKLANYLNVTPKQLTLSSGTDEGIKLILESFLAPGDEIVIPTPTFSMFSFYASRIGAEVTEILYNDDLTFPEEKLLASLETVPKVVILVNPNNPTGTVIDEDFIRLVLEKSPPSLVILDEAYFQFLGSSFVRELNEYDNLVVLQTFSKVFGLAGLRLGVILSNSRITKILRKSSSPYAVSSISCILASAAIEDTDFLQRYVDEIEIQRERISEVLTEKGYLVYPSGANFILVNFGKLFKYFIRGFRSNGILVRDRSNYPLLDQCIRVSIGPRDVMDQFIEVLEELESRPGLIFDMDGVLVDVSKSYRQAIKETVSWFSDKEISSHDIQLLKNEGGYNNDWRLTHELLRRMGVIVQFEEVKQKFQDLYLGRLGTEGLMTQEEWLLDDDLLIELSNSYPLAIFTGRPRDEALMVLKQRGVTHLFEKIVTMDDIPPDKGKPDPFGLINIVSYLGIEHGFYFGDTVDDMKAAGEAGLAAIGVIPPGHQSRNIGDKLREFGAKEVLNSINQIREVIE